MIELAATAPLARLACAELAAMGTVDETLLAGTLNNLRVADELGQLHRDIDGERLTGFVAWLRLTWGQLLVVASRGVRLFHRADNQPDGPVVFWVEQLNLAGHAQMVRRKRMLQSLPGAGALAGWRGDRLRVHRIRGA